MGTFWDERFSSKDYAYGEEPHEFLVAQKKYFPKSANCLCLADGEGRNGVWLAEQGLGVVSVDFSDVGLCKAQSLALRRGVKLKTLKADLLAWDWPIEEFDMAVAVFIHFAPRDRIWVHSQMRRALRPGGLAIVVAFTPEQLKFRTGGPPQQELLYTSDMLRRDFDGMELLYLEEVTKALYEGQYHQGTASLVRMIARVKP
jgi:SAM-dependent methyltransferase